MLTVYLYKDNVLAWRHPSLLSRRPSRLYIDEGNHSNFLGGGSGLPNFFSHFLRQLFQAKVIVSCELLRDAVKLELTSAAAIDTFLQLAGKSHMQARLVDRSYKRAGA